MRHFHTLSFFVVLFLLGGCGQAFTPQSQAPDFELRSMTDHITVARGGATRFDVQVLRRNGLSVPIALLASNVDSGLNVEPSAFEDDSATVSVAASAVTTEGEHSFTLVARAEGLEHSVRFVVAVTSPFQMDAPNSLRATEGEWLDIPVRIIRAPGFTGRVHVQLKEVLSPQSEISVDLLPKATTLGGPEAVFELAETDERLAFRARARPSRPLDTSTLTVSAVWVSEGKPRAQQSLAIALIREPGSGSRPKFFRKPWTFREPVLNGSERWDVENPMDLRPDYFFVEDISRTSLTLRWISPLVAADEAIKSFFVVPLSQAFLFETTLVPGPELSVDVLAVSAEPHPDDTKQWFVGAQNFSAARDRTGNASTQFENHPLSLGPKDYASLVGAFRSPDGVTAALAIFDDSGAQKPRLKWATVRPNGTVTTVDPVSGRAPRLFASTDASLYSFSTKEDSAGTTLFCQTWSPTDLQQPRMTASFSIPNKSRQLNYTAHALKSRDAVWVVAEDSSNTTPSIVAWLVDSECRDLLGENSSSAPLPPGNSIAGVWANADNLLLLTYVEEGALFGYGFVEVTPQGELTGRYGNGQMVLSYSETQRTPRWVFPASNGTVDVLVHGRKSAIYRVAP